MLRARGQFDCLIVGGGPAGTTLAITLAGWGRRVALVEEGRRSSRMELEDLGPEALPLVKRLGLMATLRHTATRAPRRRKLVWGDGETRDQKLESNDFAMRIDRAAFDADLRGIAVGLGVEVFEPARIEGSLPDLPGGPVTINTPTGTRRLHPRVIVAATGREVDTRIMPVAVAAQGPGSSAMIASVRGRGGHSRIDALESLPFGVLRWQAAWLPGGWGQAMVLVGEDRLGEDPYSVLVEALEGSAIGFGEVEIDHARRLDATARLVATKLPVFLIGSAAVSIDPLLGCNVEEAISDAETAAVAINTALEDEENLKGMLAHERNRQRARHDDFLARAMHAYIQEPRFADLPFWKARHEIVRVEIETSAGTQLPPRLDVSPEVGRYQVYQRRGRLLEPVIGFGLPGGPIKHSVHRIPVEPLLSLVGELGYTDEVVGTAGMEMPLCMHSRQSLLRALSELWRLGLLTDAPVN